MHRYCVWTSCFSLSNLNCEVTNLSKRSCVILWTAFKRIQLFFCQAYNSLLLRETEFPSQKADIQWNWDQNLEIFFLVTLMLMWNITWCLTVIPAGNEAVGKEGAVGLQFGWATEAHTLSWLEVVEVSSEAAAARQSLFSTFSGLAPLHTIRCWIIQPGDP